MCVRSFAVFVVADSVRVFVLFVCLFFVCVLGVKGGGVSGLIERKR